MPTPQSTFLLVAAVVLLLIPTHGSPASLHATITSTTNRMPIAAPLRAYYWQNEGMRVLGLVPSETVEVHNLSAQYFEKGRLEDHRHEAGSAEWALAYTLHLDEQGAERTITMQPFERTVLTYDPDKPQAWQVERANIGTDAVVAAGQTPLALEPPPPRYLFPVHNVECSYGPYHHDYPAADIFSPVGSEFVSTTDGVVDFVSKVDQWNLVTDIPAHRGGRSVAITGDDGWRYYGSHLSEVAEAVEPGVCVAAGQMLGRTGTSGDAQDTPPHLHYGISHPTTPDDWQVRRGEVPPYPYLQAWQRGEMIVPHP